MHPISNKCTKQQQNVTNKAQYLSNRTKEKREKKQHPPVMPYCSQKSALFGWKKRLVQLQCGSGSADFPWTVPYPCPYQITQNLFLYPWVSRSHPFSQMCNKSSQNWFTLTTLLLCFNPNWPVLPPVHKNTIISFPTLFYFYFLCFHSNLFLFPCFFSFCHSPFKTLLLIFESSFSSFIFVFLLPFFLLGFWSKYPKNTPWETKS